MAIFALEASHSQVNITLIDLGFADKDEVNPVDAGKVFEVVDISRETLEVPGKDRKRIQVFV